MSDVHDLLTRPFPEPKPIPLVGFGPLEWPRPLPTLDEDPEC